MSDMTSSNPLCFICGKTMKYGLIGIITEPTATVHKPSPTGYRVGVWRVWHKACNDEAEKRTNWVLVTTMPTVFVGWIDLTIRLVDDSKVGATTLFDSTNWRYVLECVSRDNLPAVNEYDQKAGQTPIATASEKALKRVLTPAKRGTLPKVAQPATGPTRPVRRIVRRPQ